MLSHQNLKQTLLQLDGRNYKAYKEIEGSYQFPDFTLMIDHVQGDPFAPPSKFMLKIPQKIAQFPPHLYQSPSREIALRDYLNRQFYQAAKSKRSDRGMGKSDLITIVKLGQEVLERTSILLNSEVIEVRFSVGLPARGRIILGRQAAEMITQDIPEIVNQSLKYSALSGSDIEKHVKTIEDANWLRNQLKNHKLVAFIPNGAILPRRSGVDDRPLLTEFIPFKSPPTLEISFNRPNFAEIKGMRIPEGITLIVGGGYHGKSTLLQAIQKGIYNHIPEDGREFVVSRKSTVKIRSEDGRSIVGVDISPFINHLPQGRSTRSFSTPNASGSTSQAANIIEALEMQAQVFLIDEDTAATNFMIRDQRMQKLIAKEKEPITPFIDKIRQLYQDYAVSSVLVMGGSGDYFEVADTVIGMDSFQPIDLTQKAKEVAKNYFNQRMAEGGEFFGQIALRIPLKETINPRRGQHAIKLKVRDVDKVAFGMEDIDLSGVEQIVDTSQLRAIALALVYAKERYLEQKQDVYAILSQVIADIDQHGLDILTEYPQGDLAEFRIFELAAALNRLRTLQVIQPES